MFKRTDPWIWTYDVERLQDEYQGWRKPVWVGATGWVNDDDELHYLPTLVVRVPGKKYVVIALPIKKRIKDD